MSQITIDSMILQVGGWTESQVVQLTQNVARGLAEADLGSGQRKIPSLHITVPASAAGDPTRLANWLVDALAREIRLAP